ncbi:MAG: phosphatase PAP2 family protein [Bacteroidia bacterium]|nr:phosphatase PAP2 family protein [Bacteroidia bacterium]
MSPISTYPFFLSHLRPIVFFLFFFSCITNSFSQKDLISDSRSNLLSFRGYFSTLGKNFAQQAASPFHLQTRGYLTAAALISSTLIMTTLDGGVNDEFRNLKSDNRIIHNAGPLVSSLGGTYGIAGVCAFGLAGIIFNNNDITETGLLATQAMITSGVWVNVVKILAGRERPFVSYEASGIPGGRWFGPLTQFSNPDNLPHASFESFPSGHTTTAFAIATVFAMKYKNCKAIPITAYSIATLIGASRMTENKHWLSDIFVGAALGHLCARQIMQSHYASVEKGEKKNHSLLFIMPDMSSVPSAKAVLIF